MMKASRLNLSQLRCLAGPSAAPRCAAHRRSLANRLGLRYSLHNQETIPFEDKRCPEEVETSSGQTSVKVHVNSILEAGYSTRNLQRLYAAAPENVLIYHAGTGRIVFLGMLRTATIFVCGVSTMIIAPAFFADEFAWYIAPLIVIGGALPLVFVSYTTAPFVNNIYLHLPVFARKSRETALEYVRNLPPSAEVSIRTMKITTIPRTTQVRVSDLVPDKALSRPVSFRNKNPEPIPWWRPRTLKQFYAIQTSKSSRSAPKFYPELWEHIFKRIQSQRP